MWTKAFASSALVGVITALFMTPFDTVSTRLYNQSKFVNEFSIYLVTSWRSLILLSNFTERDASGRGLMYKGIMDCFSKTLNTEGVRGLYKGLIPVYSRIAPHSMLTLMFWEKLKYLYYTEHLENAEAL